MSEDLTDKLYKWLDESGRALELRSARSLDQTPGNRLVLPSHSYEDPVTGKVREGDVLALFGSASLSGTLQLSFQLAVECKSGGDKPWIAFYDQSRHTHPARLSDWWLPCTNSDWPEESREAVLGAFEWESGLLSDRLASHAVSALGKDAVNTAQGAVMQSMSFARARATQGTLRLTGDTADVILGAVMPIVVTQAPLFACELGPDSQPSLTSVERFDVQIQVGRHRRRVYVVSEDGLATFAHALGEGLARAVR